MANVNKVILIGRVTRDPDVRYTKTGTAVADLGIAVNRTLPPEQEGGERREETTFIEVTLWSRQAELAQQYLSKGREVYIEGHLIQETWDDRQTGQKRSKLKVVAESLQFLGSKPAQGQAEASAGSKPEDKRPTPAPRQQPSRDPDLDAEPDDIPFRARIYKDVRRSKLNRRVF